MTESIKSSGEDSSTSGKEDNYPVAYRGKERPARFEYVASDDLNVFRGIIIGLPLSILIWMVIIIVVVFFNKTSIFAYG